MNYAPETQWVGGKYPGVIPKHMHHVVKKVRYVSRNPLGYKRQSIVDLARTNGPINAAEISDILRMPLDSVRSQLRIAFLQSLVSREEREHPNGNNRIMYYMGVI